MEFTLIICFPIFMLLPLQISFQLLPQRQFFPQLVPSQIFIGVFTSIIRFTFMLDLCRFHFVHLSCIIFPPISIHLKFFIGAHTHYFKNVQNTLVTKQRRNWFLQLRYSTFHLIGSFYLNNMYTHFMLLPLQIFSFATSNTVNSISDFHWSFLLS